MYNTDKSKHKPTQTTPVDSQHAKATTRETRRDRQAAGPRYPYHLPPMRIVDLGRWGIMGSVMSKTSMARRIVKGKVSHV